MALVKRARRAAKLLRPTMRPRCIAAARCLVARWRLAIAAGRRGAARRSLGAEVRAAGLRVTEARAAGGAGGLVTVAAGPVGDGTRVAAGPVGEGDGVAAGPVGDGVAADPVGEGATAAGGVWPGGGVWAETPATPRAAMRQPAISLFMVLVLVS